MCKYMQGEEDIGQFAGSSLKGLEYILAQLNFV